MKSRRYLTNAVWTLGGVLLYAMCVDVFGGYPRYDTEVLDLLGVLVLIVAGLFVWYSRRDEG